MKTLGNTPVAPRRRVLGRRDEGFTLIETALATTVMLIALMSASVATLRMHELRRQNREKTLAQNAMRSAAEQVHATSSISAGDDMLEWAQEVSNTFSVGGVIGNTFNIAELTPTTAATPIGSITVITNETLTDAELGFDFGMPRDLNGDGVVGDTNVADGFGAPARILPILINLQWTGISGNTQMSHGFYLLGY